MALLTRKQLRELPGFQVCEKTLYTWIHHGLIPDGGGERVRLPSIRHGGRRMFDYDAAMAFHPRLTGDAVAAPTQRELDAQDRQAEKEGW